MILKEKTIIKRTTTKVNKYKNEIITDFGGYVG